MSKPTGDCFDSAWRRRSTVERAGRDVVAEMVNQKHYLGCFPAVVPCILALRVDDRVVGTLIFSYPPRETATRYGGHVLELARLWISDDVPANGESWLIAQGLRYLRQHFPAVTGVVSYADPSQGHSGTIYRAANFRDDGMTDSGRKSPRCDYVADGKRYQRKSHVPEGVTAARVPRVSKHRYFYPFARQARTDA